MKFIFLSILILSNSNLFGFDIKSVDLTKEGKKKSALPYTFAPDGKKIYKDISKTIKALKNKSIEPMLGETVESMNVKIIYPIDSNKTYKTSNLAKKEKKIENKEENSTSVFADINANKEDKLESINNENKKIKLNNESKKIIPVNLEK